MLNYTVFSSINNNNEAKTKAEKKIKKKSSRQIDDCDYDYDDLMALVAALCWGLFIFIH